MPQWASDFLQMENEMRVPTYLPDASLGFDRLFNSMQKVAEVMSSNQPYPPHNLTKIGENSFEIAMALAGFTKKDITIEVKDDVLSVSSDGVEKKDNDVAKVIYGGIAFRPFKKLFLLGDTVKVVDANLKDGMLQIKLEREIPEEKKPKVISVN